MSFKVSTSKEIRRVVAEAVQRGWTTVKVAGGHGKIRSPDGRFIIHLSRTPSCPHSHLNLKRDILRVEKMSEKANSERF